MVKSASIKSLDKRHKLIPAVYIIFRRPDGKILLLKRANTGYFDSYYSLPAGHLDGSESVVAAAVREAHEEVGVSLRPQSLQLVHVIHRLSTIPMPHERVDFYFEVIDWQGKPINSEPHKCDELKWVNPKNLPANVVPEVNQALQMIIQGKLYSDLGFSS